LGGIDTYYAPYIRLNRRFDIKAIYERDLALKNNSSLEVIPQGMTCNEDEFLFVAKYVRSLGYKELNWNLGCPSIVDVDYGDLKLTVADA
jgi:tRNA-dihydrouridine synthase B